MKKLLIIIAVLGVLAFIGSKDTPTEKAEDNTAYNAYKVEFVKGCTGEDTDKSLCECAFDALSTKYDKWYQDEPRVKRILSEGYNYEEVQTIRSCQKSI